MLTGLIDPILSSVTNVFDVMVNSTCHAKKPFLKTDAAAIGDITGVIQLNGDHIRGSLAVSFPETVILKITSRVLGEPCTRVDSTVYETAAEIVNIVFGGAKKGLSENGHHFEVAIPTATAGERSSLGVSKSKKVIVVPFESEVGDFHLVLCLDSLGHIIDCSNFG